MVVVVMYSVIGHSCLFSSIDYFHIPLNTLCLPTSFAKTIVFKCSWEYAVSQEHLKTMVYAKFGGKQSVLWGMQKQRMLLFHILIKIKSNQLGLQAPVIVVDKSLSDSLSFNLV